VDLPITLTTNENFNIGGTTIVNVGGNISGGTFAITKLGAGTMALSGMNTLGRTTVVGGVLEVENSSALGSGAVVVNPTTTLSLVGGLSFNNTLTVDDGTLLNLSGSNTWSGTVGLVSTNTIEPLGSSSLTLGGVISGTGGFHKAGSGTLIVSGANTYAGGTTIVGGTLLATNASGRATGTGSVTVMTKGTLGGTGTVGAVSILAGGTLAPGTPTATGVLSTGNVLFAAGSTFVVTLNSTGFDQLNVTGTVTLNTASVSSTALVLNIPSPPPAGPLTIVQNDGTDAVKGTFAGLPEGMKVNGETFEITYKGGTGNDVVLT
jgi:autotransporter-associated beta strand protein